jgi:hypothetical protein
MGLARDVFKTQKGAEDNIIIRTEDVLLEDDFEIEYDRFDVDDDDEITLDGSTTQGEGSIVGFKEMQQMVAVVDNDEPLPYIESERIEVAKRVIRQVEDTDFFEKMIRIREDISRRIDDIITTI